MASRRGVSIADPRVILAKHAALAGPAIVPAVGSPPQPGRGASSGGRCRVYAAQPATLEVWPTSRALQGPAFWLGGPTRTEPPNSSGTSVIGHARGSVGQMSRSAGVDLGRRDLKFFSRPSRWGAARHRDRRRTTVAALEGQAHTAAESDLGSRPGSGNDPPFCRARAALTYDDADPPVRQVSRVSPAFRRRDSRAGEVATRWWIIAVRCGWC